VRRNDRKIEDPTKIMEILQKADVCRIAMSHDDVPYMVTMNFGLRKDGPPALYFHCAHEGKKLSILRKNNLVCFQTDIEHEFFLHGVACGCSMRYQSVVGMGRMHFVTDPAEKIDALQAIMAHYTKQTNHVFREEMLERTTVLRMDIEEMSGKALVKPGHPQDS
jgi:nitroimidazol reductase NimA-like FMN-containing flavoprotein (pyridoxamine 5'-phosphate oxidase superfamily)